MQSLIRHFLDRADSTEAPERPLTALERDVVTLVADGRTTKEIASVLSISEHAVERHRASVLDKLDYATG